MRLAFAAFALTASAVSAHADAVTTRIETRPYYGAITTIEHGVRVMRALPPHDRIIINPDGAARVTVNVGGADSVAGPAPTESSSSTTVYRPGGAVYGGAPSQFRRTPSGPLRPASPVGAR